MNGLVGLRAVADSHLRVQPDAACGRQGVVGVNEAAFRALEVEVGQGVGDAAELERVGAVEGARVEGDDAVPAALHGHRLPRDHGVAGRFGAEEGPAGYGGFVAAVVAEGEGVVVVGWFGEVERAGCGVLAIAGCEQGGYVVGLWQSALTYNGRKVMFADREHDVVEEEDFVESDTL